MPFAIDWGCCNRCSAFAMLRTTPPFSQSSSQRQSVEMHPRCLSVLRDNSRQCHCRLRALSQALTILVFDARLQSDCQCRQYKSHSRVSKANFCPSSLIQTLHFRSFHFRRPNRMLSRGVWCCFFHLFLQFVVATDYLMRLNEKS